MQGFPRKSHQHNQQETKKNKRQINPLAKQKCPQKGFGRGKGRKGEGKGHRTQCLVSVDDDAIGMQLGCNEHLNSQIFKSTFSQSRKSQRQVRLGNCVLIQLADKRKIERTPQQQIALFDNRLSTLLTNAENESLNYLSIKQDSYSHTQNYNCYLERKQRNLSWMKRAVLLNWMMLLASELSCKRQTLANAVNILDRYLATAQMIKLDDLQCIGAVSLMIAQKVEDNSRVKADSFHQPISEKYSFDEMLQLEIQIVIKLGFKLTAPTVNSWANRLCAQWDLYLQTHNTASFPIIYQNLSKIKFKSADQNCYSNYRWLVQYIDFSILDVQTLQYKNRTLAASFLYLTLVLRLNLYTVEQVANYFRKTPHYIEEQTPFNCFFSHFLQQSFGFPLVDILPIVQYCSIFVNLPLRFDLPALLKENEDEVMNFEEYCSIQTTNENNLNYLQKLNRSFW